MELVIDFNSIFSSFRKFTVTRKLIFNPLLDLYSPKFALNELSKYRKTVMSKAKIGIGEFGFIERMLSWKIKFIPLEDFKDFLEPAKSICPDPDDVEYFALALKLNCPIWSNDKLLKTQNAIKIFSTSELIKERGL